MYRTHLDKLVRTRLDDVLVDEGVLDRERLEAAQAESDQSDAPLSDVLIDSGAIDEWDLAKLLATHYSLPFVDVRLCSIPPSVLEMVPLDWCRRHSILPLDQFGKSITVACAEVPSAAVVEEIVQKTGCTPFLYVGLRRAIRDTIDENVKRRGSAKPVGAKAAAGAAAAASAAPAAPADDLPPLPADLPRISLQLNASAAAFGGRKTLVERFGRPTVSTTSVSGAPAVAPAAPAAAATVPPVQKVSPMQQILGRKSVPGSSAPAPSPAPAQAAARRDEAPRPKIAGSGRAAPVLPPAPAPAGAAAARAPATPAGAPAKKAAGPHGAWESIFDIGEEAVRASHPGDRDDS